MADLLLLLGRMHRLLIALLCVLLCYTAVSSAALRVGSDTSRLEGNGRSALSSASIGRMTDGNTHHSGHSTVSAPLSSRPMRLGSVDTFRHSAHADHATPDLTENGEGLHVRSAKSAYNALVDPVSLALNSSLTNASLEAWVCGLLTGKGIMELAIEGSSNPSIIRDNLYFTLPSCVYGSNSLRTLVLNRIIILDTSLTSDRKTPLSVFSPTLEALGLVDCILQPKTTTTGPYSVNWSSMFAFYPQMTALTLSKVGLTGPLPATLPSALNALNLDKNLFTGTIPATILSNHSASDTFVQISAAQNLLTGSLPRFQFSPSNTLTSLNVDFSLNQLDGTIPTDWMNSIQLGGSGSPSIVIDLSWNQLSGPLPADLLYWSLSPYRSDLNVKIDLSHNNLTERLPQALLAPSSITKLECYLDYNSLSGQIPSDLFYPSSVGVNLTQLVLSLSNNQLDGTLPDALFREAHFIWPQPTSTSSVTVSFASNRIYGTIPTRFFDIGSSFPLSTLSIDWSNNSLTGTIPPDLLVVPRPTPATSMTFDLNLSQNSLSGAIPASLLNNTYINEAAPIFGTLKLDLSHNSLSSTIPAHMFFNSSFYHLNVLELDFSNNVLQGTIPADVFSIRPLADGFAGSLSVSFAQNQLSGSVPMFLIGTVTGSGFGQIVLDFSSNLITGLPATPSLRAITDIVSFSLSFKNNSIGSNLSPSFLPNYVNYLPLTMSWLTLDFSYNPMGGSIPSSLLNATATYALNLYLDNCNLESYVPSNLLSTSTFRQPVISLASNHLIGPFPEDLLRGIPDSLTTIKVILDNNPIGGQLTSSAFEVTFDFGSASLTDCHISLVNTSLSGPIPSNLARSTTYELHLGHNSFTELDLASMIRSISGLILNIQSNDIAGDLVVPAPSTIRSLQLRASKNLFSSLSVDDEAYKYLEILDVANIPALSGRLPVEIMFSSTLMVFNASNTSLTGTASFLSSDLNSAAELDLANTKIDFCSADSNVLVAKVLSSCSLDFTSAVGCPHLYPSICFKKTDFSTNSCPISTRPSPAFVCVNGVWTFFGNTGNGTLVIPGSGSTTVVQGNLGATEVVLQSATSTLVIYGCANNLTSITISLTQEELKALGSNWNQTLITLAGNSSSCKALDNISINVNTEGCRKIMVKSSQGSQASFSALFTIDSSRCNRWWIILVSVICGVVVLAAIIFALLVAFVPKVRATVRPYSTRKNAASGNVS